jgi:hypothetical protein
VLAAAVLAGGAFGVGYAVAAGGTPKPKLIVRAVPARLDAGPGFLPDPDWTVEGSTAVSGSGTRIEAQFSPASEHPSWPQKLLPLQLPPSGRLRAHVGASAVEVTVTFPGKPSPGEIVAAREEIGRLVVPSCPAARPLAPRDAGRAGAYVLRGLPSHYFGDPRDVAGARATTRLGPAMPRHGEAVADCGDLVARRSAEVDVVLPRVAKVSASLSQLSYFVAKTTRGWVVWERAR